jgi:hypothetical protein
MQIVLFGSEDSNLIGGPVKKEHFPRLCAPYVDLSAFMTSQVLPKADGLPDNVKILVRQVLDLSGARFAAKCLALDQTDFVRIVIAEDETSRQVVWEFNKPHEVCAGTTKEDLLTALLVADVLDLKPLIGGLLGNAGAAHDELLTKIRMCRLSMGVLTVVE